MLLKEEKLRSNFIQDCLNGKALLTDIDDYIDTWHDQESDIPIFDFLGMSKKEYALFVEDETYLAKIVMAHRDKININEIMREQIPMAARADSSHKAARLQRWLENEGLWE